MTIIADFMVAAGGFAAAFYCYLLAGRLRKFTALESGIGSAIAVLSVQVDEMTAALAQAKLSADTSSAALETKVLRAEAAANRLEVILASLRDIEETMDYDIETGRSARFIRRRPQRSSLRVAE